MRNKIIITVGLSLLLLNSSSCVMRQVREPRSYHQLKHTHRHYGRERHTNVRRMYWGKHRSGMRPYKNRGQVRY